MAGKIFISYRRDDEQAYAVRLYERLAERFGAKEIFFDVNSIPYGSDFAKYIGDQIALSGVVLVVIGNHWLNAREAEGRRRLENSNDFVRIEIESALKQDKVVVPILVKGTPMPRAKELPRKMQALAGKQAFVATHVGFTSEIPRLIDAIENVLQIGKRGGKAFDPGALAESALNVLGTKGKEWLKPLEARVSEVAKSLSGDVPAEGNDTGTPASRKLEVLKNAGAVMGTRTREWLQPPPVRPEFLVRQEPEPNAVPGEAAGAGPSGDQPEAAAIADTEPEDKSWVLPDLPDRSTNDSETVSDIVSENAASPAGPDNQAAKAAEAVEESDAIRIAETRPKLGTNEAPMRPVPQALKASPRTPPPRVDPRDKPIWRIVKYVALGVVGFYGLLLLGALLTGR